MDQNEVVITSSRGLLDLKLNMVWKYRNLIYMLVKRDFIIYYKQTILGPLWYLIQPIFSTVMYMIVFGNLAKIGTDSVPQPLFYFTGTMLWTYFADNLQKSSRTFIDNKELFGKVYFPRVVVAISNVFVNTIKLGIQFVLFLFVYLYYLVHKDIEFSGTKILIFIISIIWIAIIAIGLGMVISSITSKYRDIAMAMEFLVPLFMYAAPVVYPVSEAAGKLRTVLCFNPLTAPIEVFRYAFFGAGAVPAWSVIYSVTFSVLVLFIGMIVFNQNEQKFIDVI